MSSPASIESHHIPISRKRSRDEPSKGIEETFDLAAGMHQLRITKDIQTTFAQFATASLGNLATSFLGLITSDQTTESSTASSSKSIPVSSAASSSARFYYESAIKGIKPRSPSDESTESRKARIGETYMLWERWGPEIISFSTIGVPSGRGDGDGSQGEEPLVRRCHFSCFTLLVLTSAPRILTTAHPIIPIG